MSWAAEGGRDSRITRLTLTRRYLLYQVIWGRHIQCIPLRRASRNINPLQVPLTQQNMVPLEVLSPQLQQPIRKVNGLW